MGEAASGWPALALAITAEKSLLMMRLAPGAAVARGGEPAVCVERSASPRAAFPVRLRVCEIRRLGHDQPIR